jgi:hypothetical protein
VQSNVGTYALRYDDKANRSPPIFSTPEHQYRSINRILALSAKLHLPRMTEALKVLNGEAGVDLDVLARDTRVLGQGNEHIRAVLEIRL